jgi:hypothetical protein
VLQRTLLQLLSGCENSIWLLYCWAAWVKYWDEGSESINLIVRALHNTTCDGLVRFQAALAASFFTRRCTLGTVVGAFLVTNCDCLCWSA